MMRLANYFLVVGYDYEQSKGGIGEGKVVQKFPTIDWRDCPFDQSIQEFCQPGGWHLTSKPRSPNFMVCALTNSTGGRLYCACLTFDEPTKEDDVIVYAPKSLVLLSSHNYCNLLKNCLSLIYTIFTDELPFEVENVVSNILAEIPIPSPGGPRVTFSLGAGDTHAVQPPQCGKIPITSQAVSLLFQLLGIQNVLMLFSAMLTDQKILITSRSFVRLFDICHALSSLLYPLRYVCVYIPVLPKKLLDYLSTPTPCLVGIHVSFLELVNETYEFCIADIDKGSVEPPRNLAPSEILMVSEPFYSTMLANLTQILNPDLLIADLVFAPSAGSGHVELMQDKRLRAVFLHFFLQLFVGYRSCLSITRVHPHPVIHFNQSLFMLLRGLPDTDEFLTRFFLGMTFPQFIQERGSPYREVDLFDRMVAKEVLCRDTSIEAVDRLAEQLMENERDLYPPEDQSLPKPKSPSSPARVFPTLDDTKMERKLRRKAERFPHCDEDEWAVKASNVPMGPVLDLDHCLHVSTHDQHTKLNVLRACLDAIFDNRISDAKKVLRAVKRDLKSRVLRHQLVRLLERLMSQPPSATVASPSVQALSGLELEPAAQSGPFWPDLTRRGPLQRAQFDLVVELLEEALRQDAAGGGTGGGQVGTLGHFWLMGELGELEAANGVRFGLGGGEGGGGGAGRGGGRDGGGGAPSESDHCGDCSGIAASVLHIATQLHMQVHNVKFFAYMCEEVQKHPVWQSQKFWKSFLHLEVAKQIHQLYLTQYPSKATEGEEATGIEQAMDAAAEELRRWPDLEESARATWVAQEERSVVFQIQHCLTAMLHFRLPVHISERRYQQHLEGFGAGENASSVMTNSDDGIDSMDRESGIDDQAQANLLASLDHFMRRFVRVVAAENDLPQHMVESLEEKIEGLREGDIATLEEVRREVKRPRPARTEIAPPQLLAREELLLEAPLRAFLLPDGRWDPTEQLQEAVLDASPSGRASAQLAVSQVPEGHLPAEGAIFLTNYRLIFLGIPVDCLLTDRQICRSFPVASLMVAKKLGTQRVPALASLSKDDAFEVMLLRAATFQLLRVAFEEDVPREAPDIFRDLLLSVRYPLRQEPSFLSHAAIQEQEMEKAGHSTGKSKNTFTRVRKFCMRKVENTRQKMSKRTLGLPSSTLYRPTGGASQRLRSSSSTSSAATGVTMPRPFIGNESKYLEWLQHRPSYRDFQRQGLGHFPGTFSVRQTRAEGFKLSMGNAKYQLCRSYPAMFVVPAVTAERSLTRLGRGHREGRFPVITFRHVATRALLLRAGGFRPYQSGGNWRSGSGAGMATIREREGSDSVDCSPGGSTSEFMIEQERYLSALVAHSPDPETISLQGVQEPLFPLETPLPTRRDVRDSGRSRMSDASLTTQDVNGVVLRRPLSGSMQNLGLRNNAPSGERRWSQYYVPPATSGQLSGGYQRGRSAFDPDLSSATDLEASSQLSAGSGLVQRLTLGPLVILGEKSQMKTFSKVRGARQNGVSFLPVAPQFSRKTLKESFKKLYRLCVGPEAASVMTGASGASGPSFQAQLQQNDWLRQVKGALQLAGVVVDIMDAHGSSVMVSLEEGWDITTQVVSLAELMLDPHYRTLEGFAQLIDKEWLSFGHRFTQRASQVAEVRPSGYSPVFLLFLDCVHQLLRQFPTRFEFNDFYLQFLAYHHLSGRFSTFKFDCEAERMEAAYTDPESSIWSFIEAVHKRSPVFFNFAYSPSAPSPDAPAVLRPTTNVASLAIWGYYLHEELVQRSVFDVDLLLAGMEPKGEAEEAPVVLLQTNYNCGLTTSMHSPFYELLREAGPEWMDLWNSVQGNGEEEEEEAEEEEELVEMERARQVSMRYHRKATREILRKGRQLGEDADIATKEEAVLFKQAHQFSNVTFPAQKCDLCSHLCFGEKAVVCSQCKYFCHVKCVVNAPKNCSRPSTSSSVSQPPAQDPSVLSPARAAPPPRPPPPSDLPTAIPPAPPPRPPPVPAHATPPEASSPLSSPSSPSPGPLPVAATTVTARPAVGRASPVNRPRRSSLGSLGNGTDFGSRGIAFDEKLSTLGPHYKAQSQQLVSHRQHHQPQSQQYQRHQLQQQTSQSGGGRSAAARSAHRGSMAGRETPAGSGSDFSGYLYKQGQYLRQWKRRFFILDSVRHQLQYYESEDPSTYRGFIPLDNVKSVKLVQRSSGTPMKKLPDHAHIIEVETDRPHRFAVDDSEQANTWCEKLQASIS